MKTVTLTSETGDTWTTEANGSLYEICRYFLGNSFNRGGITWDHDKNCEVEIDDMQTVLSCEIDGKAYSLNDLFYE